MIEVGHIDIEVERVVQYVNISIFRMILSEGCILYAQKLFQQVLFISEIMENNSLHHVISYFFYFQRHQRTVDDLHPQSIQSQF